MAITINGTTGITAPDDAIIKLGSSDDLQIQHNGTDSVIAETVNNRRFLIAGDDIRLRKADQSEDLAQFKADGAVELFHNGTKTFETTSTGHKIHMSSGEPTFTIHCDTDSSPLASIELMRGANDTFGGGAYTDWKIADASGGVFTIYQGENGSTTSRITINTSGVLSGDLNDTSDEKKKKDITSIPDGAIAKIKQLRPVNFNWKDPLNKANQSGFIAQEVKTVIPDLVVGEEYDETKDNIGYAINTSGVVAHLTKALQEAIAKIETLETKVAALEAA
tara:strand:- start:387 stop:1220 length:834 start_codon:yes stop_codon:yes gene_type:complete